MSGAANAGEVRARLTLDNSNFTQNMQNARDEMNKLKTDSEDVKKGVDKIGEGAGIMGGAVVAAIGASVKAAADFQSSMSRFQAMSNASASQMSDVQQAAQEWGAKTKYSATEAADAMTNLSMAGFTVQQSIDGLPGVLAMAAAGNLDLGNAAEIAGNALNIFHLKATDLTHVADVLAEGANTSNADITDLATSMQYAGPVAAGLGLSLEQTTAALALMSNAGIKGSESGTTLRASLLSLAQPVGQAGKEMAALHLNVKDAHGSLLPLPEILDRVKASMSKMTDSQKTAAAAALVGREAASGFITLINAGGKGLSDYTSQLQNSQGAAQKMAATMQDNLAGAWENFTGSLENLGIKIGTQFLPTLQALTNKGTDFLNFLTDLDPSVINTALAVAGVTSALALMGVGVFKAIEAFKILQATFIASPWGLALTGIALLGGAIAGLVVQQEASRKVSMDTYDALDKQQTTLQTTADTFDKLRNKSKLTNDEMLTYLDLQSQLANTSDPNRIKTLTGAMDLLQQKSGLSKDEMNKLVSANKDLIDQAPDTQLAVSKTGNAFATSSTQAHALTQELQQQKQLQLEIQQAKIEKNVGSDVTNYQNSRQDLNAAIDDRNEKMQTLVKIQQEAYLLDQRELDAQKLHGKAKADELDSIKQARTINQAEYNTAKDNLTQANLTYLTKQQSVQTSQAQLDKDKEIYTQINQNLLAQVGLKSAQGQELQTINSAIAAEKVKAQKIADSAGGVGKLKGAQKEAYDQVQATIKKYQETSGAIQDNNKKQGDTNKTIQTGKDNADKLHTSLSKDVSKHIKFTGDGMKLSNDIQDSLQKDAHKNVIISFIEDKVKAGINWAASKLDIPIHITRHNGGTLPKFHDGGSPSFTGLGAPLKDEVDARLLRNEMVLTAQQQANLFNMIKGYNPAAISSMAKQASTQPQAPQVVQVNVATLHVREEADVKRIAEQLQKLSQQRQRSRGEY